MITPAILLAFCAIGVAAEKPVADTRATLARWVETRQMISRLKAEWAEDRETLENTIALFKAQQERLDEKLAKVGEASRQVVKETADNEAQLKKYLAALDKLEALVGGFEAKLKAQVKNYPPPLASQELVAKVIELIPDDPKNTRTPLISRVQNLILILKAAQEFNSELHVLSEVRRKGEQDLQVRTIYLGLGQAWFVSEDGSFAGRGGPSPEGWQWTEDAGIAGQVRQALAVYEKSQPAAYVALKAEVK